MRIKSLATLLATMTLILAATPAHGEDGTTKIILGSGNITIIDPVSGMEILGTGFDTCQDQSAILPFKCDVSGSGGVRFDIRHLNGAIADTVVEGIATLQVISCNLCGSMRGVVGTDRDDDGFITTFDTFDNDDFLMPPGTSTCNRGFGLDPADHDHGTSCTADDQISFGDFTTPVQPGDQIQIPFCFAKDTRGNNAGLDWDDLNFFMESQYDNPTVGTIIVTLDPLIPVGNHISFCSATNVIPLGAHRSHIPLPAV